MIVQKIKVYELAKELGLESMTLLDKLKELEIDVKSHMSELGSEEAKIIREHVTKEKVLQSKTTKATKKKDTDALTQKRVTATVIRRRAKSEEAPATTTPTPVPAIDNQATESLLLNTSGQPSVTNTPEEATTHEKAAQSPPVAASMENSAAPQPQTTLKGSGLKIPSLLGARASGEIQSLNRTSSILNVVKEEPKKTSKPPTSLVMPVLKTSSPASVSPGIVSLGKEAIDRLVEEEQTYKKKGSKVEKELGANVRVADYRAKKELVFLPKKKKLPINKELKRTQITTPSAHKRIIKIENVISVLELAQRMGIKTSEVVKKLVSMGVMATINQVLDIDTAILIATDYHYEVENVAFKEEQVLVTQDDKSEDLKLRPPVVTVMGHVDHGKTSLLDTIRSENVASGEAGGITQHIGAYTVVVNDKQITFIDTPGHEAFTVMRARGANVTDIVVLVVAADDGVMPQTREAVDHAKAAGVPIIVALNKIDKPDANPEKVTKQLSELGLLPEAWGGENIFVQVSATKKTGIQELLENILLQAEILNLKANPNRPAEATILEARLDRHRGPLVNILVRKGTLNVGEVVVVGTFLGKVKALTSSKGAVIKTLGPSCAAEMLGLEGVPSAGDTLYAFRSEVEAKKLVEHRVDTLKTQAGAPKPSKMSLEELFSKVQQGETKELSVVLKTDVYGSSEAIKDSLMKLSTDKVRVKILHSSTGGITESDIMLAAASNAIVIGFNVRPETKALQVAETENVDVKTYSIIYELIDDIKKAMGGLLDKKVVEKYMGRAEVRETFVIPKAGTIAGSSVIDGKITRACHVRILRDSRVIYSGKLSSLRRFKDDTKEVSQGYECGIGIENFNDLKQGDLLEAYMVELVAQELDSSPPLAKEANTPGGFAAGARTAGMSAGIASDNVRSASNKSSNKSDTIL